MFPGSCENLMILIISIFHPSLPCVIFRSVCHYNFSTFAATVLENLSILVYELSIYTSPQSSLNLEKLISELPLPENRVVIESF